MKILNVKHIIKDVRYHNNDFQINNSIVTFIIKNINYLNSKNINNYRIFVSFNILEYFIFNYSLFRQFIQINKINKENGHDLLLIGNLQGYDVYSSNILDENEVFIGTNEREINILKRKNKIDKITNR